MVFPLERGQPSCCLSRSVLDCFVSDFSKSVSKFWLGEGFFFGGGGGSRQANLWTSFHFLLNCTSFYRKKGSSALFFRERNGTLRRSVCASRLVLRLGYISTVWGEGHLFVRQSKYFPAIVPAPRKRRLDRSSLSVQISSVVDPDPYRYVFGPPGSFHHQAKIVRIILISTVLCLLFDFLPVIRGSGSVPKCRGPTTLQISLWCVCSCKDLINADLLSKSDPFCVVSTRQSHDTDWIELFRTETIQVTKGTVA